MLSSFNTTAISGDIRYSVGVGSPEGSTVIATMYSKRVKGGICAASQYLYRKLLRNIDSDIRRNVTSTGLLCLVLFSLKLWAAYDQPMILRSCIAAAALLAGFCCPSVQGRNHNRPLTGRLSVASECLHEVRQAHISQY